MSSCRVPGPSKRTARRALVSAAARGRGGRQHRHKEASARVWLTALTHNLLWPPTPLTKRGKQGAFFGQQGRLGNLLPGQNKPAAPA